MNKKTIGTIFELIEDILTKHPTARDDFYECYMRVLNKYGISADSSIREIAEFTKGGKIPTFETIARIKRKVIELHPEFKNDAYKNRVEYQQNVIDNIAHFENA